MTYKMALKQWTHLADCLKDKGAVYFFYPSRNDGFVFMEDDPEGLPKFHVHTDEKSDDDDMFFFKLLPKSSNFREGEQINLAEIALSDWVAACSGMNKTTIDSVSCLKKCFETLGAVKTD